MSLMCKNKRTKQEELDMIRDSYIKTVIEPFKIKSVEPIRFTSAGERNIILKKAGYNPFLIDAENVMIDLLTDSGTSAMSSKQWAGILDGDESYAGSKSFYRMDKVVRKITGFKRREKLRGMRFTYEAPILRHFTARFKKI